MLVGWGGVQDEDADWVRGGQGCELNGGKQEFFSSSFFLQSGSFFRRPRFQIKISTQAVLHTPQNPFPCVAGPGTQSKCGRCRPTDEAAAGRSQLPKATQLVKGITRARPLSSPTQCWHYINKNSVQFPKTAFGCRDQS